MRIVLPNSAHLQNLAGFIRKYDPNAGRSLNIRMDKRWIHVHPFALAMTACAGALATLRGQPARGRVPRISSVRYLLRMKLFDFVDLDSGIAITEHEEAGRFIPITQIRTGEELRDAITNLIPLLHAPANVADPIKYVFSEMVRNVLEHARSPVGAFVCAQYYSQEDRLSIGIADAGIGILRSIRQSHAARDDEEAIGLALRPGITGATRRIGGTETNAGAGLFFTKGIAALSRNFFAIYSGSALYKLLRARGNQAPTLHADPTADRHNFAVDLPHWQGTVVGINVSVGDGKVFADLLSDIRKAYRIDVKHQRKQYYKKIRFVR